MLIYRITIEDKVGNVKQEIIKSEKPYKEMLDMLRGTNVGYDVKVLEIDTKKVKIIKKELGDN